jgi:hypothetical protein
MVDCVVILQHPVVDGSAFRNLRVKKYRGSGFAADEFPITLTTTGLQLTNRGPTELQYEVPDERISSGLPRLDVMLRGGYHRGSMVLISGAPGTAKSTLSGLFAAAACQRGERTLYVSFDEGAAQIIRNLKSVGIRLAPYQKSGVLKMYSTRTRGPKIEDQFGDLRAKVREYRPRCLVIDPLSALSTKVAHLASADAAQQFLDFLQGRRDHGGEYVLDGRTQRRDGGHNRHRHHRRYMDPPLVRRAGRRAQPRPDDREIARYRALEPGSRADAFQRRRHPHRRLRRPGKSAHGSGPLGAGTGRASGEKARPGRCGPQATAAATLAGRGRGATSSHPNRMEARSAEIAVLALATGSASKLLVTDRAVLRKMRHADEEVHIAKPASGKNGNAKNGDGGVL